MAKGKQPDKKSNKNDSGVVGIGIGRFFLPNPESPTSAAAPDAGASDTPRRQTESPPVAKTKQPAKSKIKKGSKSDAGGGIAKFAIRKPSASAASATSSSNNGTARRKLQFGTPTRKKQKSKTTMQLSIGQAFKPPSLAPNAASERNDIVIQADGLESNERGPEVESSLPRARDYPDPASMPADHRVTEIQFRRDAFSVLPAIRQPILHSLNVEQRRVVECPPNVPLSVRAGAGSGKTFSMVQRALYLINTYGIKPEHILIITFSNKATDELKERIYSAMTAKVPMIKTFHGLAFSWICRCWKACGLGKFPCPLGTKSQEISLMRRAIEENLNRLRLERCRQMLWTASDRPSRVSWEAIVQTFRGKYANDYDELHSTADEQANELMPGKKAQEAMTAEEFQELRAKIREARKEYLRFECYLELLRRKQANKKHTSDDEKDEIKASGIDCNIKEVKCDLMKRWSGDYVQCNQFLDMVRKGRLGGHSKNEYLPDDAIVWKIYDDLQRETGRIDFDTMLVLFNEKILRNETLARRFQGMYTHVIVDEFQDNSSVQAEMLNKIVQGGCLTVVGDDDQCIYMFRGASPGNFNRLKDFFSEERQITIQEETLTENHRSSANILAVAATFLEGDTHRHPKVLRPTKPPGLPVEIWNCQHYRDQASHIVSAMIERHQKEGVAYGEMACLFRCFKMGVMGPLTLHLQKELAIKNVPFVVTGGSTIFERASVRNLLAYLRLSIRGSPDNEALGRVINTPSRRLPAKKMLPLIKQHLKSDPRNNQSLQEAAKMMCETRIGLSTSRHKALKGFISLIDRLQEEVNSKPLPELLKFIWHETGLDQPKKKGGNKDDDSATNENPENETDDSDAGESDNSRLDISTLRTKPTSSQQETCDIPDEVELLIDLAQRFVSDWKEREEKITSKSRSQNVLSLVELTRNAIMQNKGLIEIDELPNHIQDEIILSPCGLGRTVIKDFLACTAMQNSVEHEEPNLSNDDVGRVSVSTVHRAKGLEWSDVYVPYFNQGFMPTEARIDEDNDKRGQRHLPGCSATHGDRCDKSCAKIFQEMDAMKLGATVEELHKNEERRLAHVAATRAKDRLVFTSFQIPNHRGIESKFMKELRRLPNSVIKVVSKK